jgi:hypothetical protein
MVVSSPPPQPFAQLVDHESQASSSVEIIVSTWAALRGTKFTGNSLGRLKCHKREESCLVERCVRSEPGGAIFWINLHRFPGDVLARLNVECPEHPNYGNPSAFRSQVVTRAFSPV